MKYHNHFAVVLLAAASIAAYAQTSTTLTAFPPAAYEQVFRHVVHLQARDADIAAKNATPANFSSYYKKLANLTQPQSDALQSISQAAVKDLAALDQQAQALMQQTYAQRVQGQKLPPPPAQLATLQAQRTALLNSYRSQLQTAIGATAFANLEQALLANLKSSAKATPVH